MINRLFYNIKPFVPRKFQIFLRQQISNYKRNKSKHVWPINPDSGQLPDNWHGWPEDKQFSLILSHDVDTQKGHDRVMELLNIEKELGFRSSFNFVPEKYKVSRDLIEEIKKNGFEVSVHGLKHDGKLFRSKKIFKNRSSKINFYLKDWASAGFTAPAMICNLEWLHLLQIGHSTCTFDTDPFEPLPNPAGCIFPYFITNEQTGHSSIEIPYTLPQDHSLYIILKEKNNDIWKKKLDWLVERGGMAMMNTHTDYMNFNQWPLSNEEYPIDLYVDFLTYIKEKYKDAFWHALPSELAEFWRKNAPRNKKDRFLNIKTVTEMNDYNRRVCVLGYTFYENDFRVMRYANALTEAGDHVDVFSLRTPGEDFEAELNGVKIFKLQERIINEKGKFSYLFRILRFFFKSFFAISKKHFQHPYDLVHVHNVPDFLVFAAIMPKLLGAKIILDIHDILPEFYASKFSNGKKGMIFKMMALIEKMSIGFSDHVIISNHIWKKRLETRSLQPHKCTAIINFVDQNIFKPHPRLGNNDNLIALYPGTVNWHQGLDIAVQAMALIKDKVPNLFFHIYGSGTHFESIKQMIDELDLTGRVKIFPIKSLSEISEIMANSDMGIIPKRNDQFGGEAFSTKTLEFMAVGIPIVVSRTKVDNYYFDDSIASFFEPENFKDLSDKMLALIKNPSKRAAQADRAKQYIKSNNWDVKKQIYLDLVDSLLSRP